MPIWDRVGTAFCVPWRTSRGSFLQRKKMVVTGADQMPGHRRHSARDQGLQGRAGPAVGGRRRGHSSACTRRVGSITSSTMNTTTTTKSLFSPWPTGMREEYRRGWSTQGSFCRSTTPAWRPSWEHDQAGAHDRRIPPLSERFASMRSITQLAGLPEDRIRHHFCWGKAGTARNTP